MAKIFFDKATMKRCIRCLVAKPLKEFTRYYGKVKDNNRHASCKKCLGHK